MSDADFIAAARETYAAANAATLRWMLARPPLHGAFINTKLNSITLANYGAADGPRGPDYLYGWIQGRGLEAVVTHAAFFADRDPELTVALDAAGQRLYAALRALVAADGHAYFCYDAALQPICVDTAGTMSPQASAGDVYTYSDAFVAKGLAAAAARYAPAELAGQLDYLDAVIAAIPAGRFQMDEKRRLSLEVAAAQPNDYGPRMILLGAAGLLRRIGQPERAGYAEAFMSHILAHHFDAASGLLVDVPGTDYANVGHAIEFVGFALEYYGEAVPRARLVELEALLLASFRAGFAGPGIALAVSPATRRPLSPNCPWWSLPETIRAAALCHARSGSPEALDVWRQAHGAFFQHYWRETPPLAYQTMTANGPIDFVPATPDLDPGYHTGLSLLAAIED